MERRLLIWMTASSTVTGRQLKRSPSSIDRYTMRAPPSLKVLSLAGLKLSQTTSRIRKSRRFGISNLSPSGIIRSVFQSWTPRMCLVRTSKVSLISSSGPMWMMTTRRIPILTSGALAARVPGTIELCSMSNPLAKTPFFS